MLFYIDIMRELGIARDVVQVIRNGDLLTLCTWTWYAWKTYVFHASLCMGIQAVTDDHAGSNT